MDTTPDILALFLSALLCGLTGTGLAVLVLASPLPGWIPRKPFVCRTCLSGWGSIGAAFWLVPPIGLHTSARSVDDFLCCWLLLALAGTGLAHLLFGLADSGPTKKSADLPLPTFEPPNSTNTQT